MRWTTRFRGPAPAAARAATEAEAQRDARRAATEALEQQVEALKQQLAERDALIVRLTARLRVAEVVEHTTQWMKAPARAARNLDPDLTSVVPASLIRKPERGRHR
jgi:hypothetical protein